jgi:lipopolysaccharide/colanic/teichoic acid biosynthesis glycosyltransferase
MLKRATDIIISAIGVVVLSPLLFLIAVSVALTSKGGVFYLQTRVGKNGRDFNLLKFRTMRPKSDKGSLLTIGARDPRITPVGYFLRKYKLDELPQLFNVLGGSMSLVGPRPEVRKYVDLYTQEQRRVLTVKPGITDYASIEYFAESELLAASPDPERTYIEEVMPAKLALNTKYIGEAGFGTDMRILFHTVARIFRN